MLLQDYKIEGKNHYLIDISEDDLIDFGNMVGVHYRHYSDLAIDLWGYQYTRYLRNCKLLAQTPLSFPKWYDRYHDDSDETIAMHIRTIYNQITTNTIYNIYTTQAQFRCNEVVVNELNLEKNYE